MFKEGRREDVNNYRPISVLPILSKVFERVIHNHTYDYISNANLLSDRQSGFRKRHSTQSTVTCLIDFLNAIYNDIEEGRFSGVLFLDLKKAFDTVDNNNNNNMDLYSAPSSWSSGALYIEKEPEKGTENNTSRTQLHE